MKTIRRFINDNSELLLGISMMIFIILTSGLMTHYVDGI